MRIRAVTAADEAAIRALWEAFEAEVPEPPGFQPETWDEAWPDLRRHAERGVALVAEDDEGAVAFAFVREPGHGRAHITDVFVAPRARRGGLATELLRQAAEGAQELGAEWLSLDVVAGNAPARALYERLGFEDAQVVMAARAETVLRLSADRDVRDEVSFGAAYVQTDDQAAVVSAVERFVPRLHRSGASVVLPPNNGWVAVHDQVTDREPERLRRLAAELSHVTGAPVLTLGVEQDSVVRLIAFERGQVLDEYVSVPEHFGPLPPGDVVALRANATVLSRLTGAEPAAIRAIARNASSVSELPPPPEHAGSIAEALGLVAPLPFDEVAAGAGAVIVEHD